MDTVKFAVSRVPYARQCLIGGAGFEAIAITTARLTPFVGEAWAAGCGLFVSIDYGTSR
jgi:hypothetical protein